MKVTLKSYGVLQIACEQFEQALELPEKVESVTQLRAWLLERFPKLEKHEPRMAIAINDESASAECILHQGDCIALLPPVGGGQ